MPNTKQQEKKKKESGGGRDAVGAARKDGSRRGSKKGRRRIKDDDVDARGVSTKREDGQKLFANTEAAQDGNSSGDDQTTAIDKKAEKKKRRQQRRLEKKAKLAQEEQKKQMQVAAAHERTDSSDNDDEDDDDGDDRDGDTRKRKDDRKQWHPVLKLADKCDMEAYDRRFVDATKEEKLSVLKEAKDAISAATFSEARPCRALPGGYEERRVPGAEGLFPEIEEVAGEDMVSRDIRSQLHPRIAYDKGSLASFPAGMFHLFCSYRDVYFTERTLRNARPTRSMYMLHIVNHLMKARAYILRHNEMLDGSADTDEDECRDQGFTRAKALLVLPYRHSALLAVNHIAKLLCSSSATKKRQLRHRKRFVTEYGVEDEAQQSEHVHPNEEYREIFKGNVDDCFVMGVAIKNLSVNLYQKLERSDLIIGSPLGIKQALEKAKEEKASNFLSAVEVLVVDQADAYHMQNIDHLRYVFEQLNQPTLVSEVDITRIRYFCHEGLGDALRQTIVVSAMPTPDLNALFRRNCANAAGKVVVSKPQSGTIQNVAHANLSQVFIRLTAPTHYRDVPDVHFEHFVRHLQPLLSSATNAHTLVFVPSYFDFVRLRNHLRKARVKFAQICEYTSGPNVSRARTDFYHARKPFLLYTERYHYHHRPAIRSIKHVIFYALPMYPQYYAEMLNLISGDVAADATCTVLYTAFDAERLARVVGSQRAEAMLTSVSEKHLFT